MVRRAHGMRPVDFEVQARVGEPIEHEHRRHSACEGTERTDVPLEQINIETGSTFGKPFEEFTEFVRSLESCTLGFELDPGVEIPPDQHDAFFRPEHRRLGVTEIVGGVDYAGQPLRSRNSPAGGTWFEHGLGHERMLLPDRIVPGRPHDRRV